MTRMTIYRWQADIDGETVVQVPIPARDKSTALARMRCIVRTWAKGTVIVRWSTFDGESGRFKLVNTGGVLS